MPTFHYTARDAAGAEHHGTMAGDDEAAVRKALRYRGLHATHVVADPSTVPQKRGFLAAIFRAREDQPPETGTKSR